MITKNEFYGQYVITCLEETGGESPLSAIMSEASRAWGIVEKLQNPHLKLNYISPEDVAEASGITLTSD